MKIAVLLPASPFIYGGAEKMADDLVFYLNKYGHLAKRYDTVFHGTKLRHIIKAQLNSQMLKFDDVDMVIPLLPINVSVFHHNVVPWLIGQAKVVYEFFDNPTIGYGKFGTEGRIVSDLCKKNDTIAMKKMSRIYTISPRTKELFQKYNHITTQVLVLPLQNSDAYYCKEYGDFVMYHSRIYPQKRQHLVVEAMSYTKTQVKLLIAGADNESQYTNSIKKYVEEHHLEDKVILKIGRFSDEQKYDWLSRCLGGFYLGEDEDYWAIVTTEVMMSKKPVIAPNDTGATKYVVIDGKTGYQPEATPQAIAEAIDKLYLDKKKAQYMGEAGDVLIREISPSWEMVVKTLTGEIE